MTDMGGTKPVPFMSCLVYESKKAYSLYLKVVGVVGLIIAIIVGFYLLIITVQFESILGDILIVPWWIYLILLVISPPGMYSILECVKKRIGKNDRSVSGAVLLMSGVLAALFGICTLNPYCVIFAIVIIIVGLCLL